MIKFFARFFILVLAIFIFSIIFLSYAGLETDKFDTLIKSKANEVNRHVKLEFQKTKIYLNPKELNLVVKLQNPAILVKNNEIILSKLDLFLPIRSFFTSDFILKRSEIAFARNDIKDLTKITRVFLPKIINKKLNKIFLKGSLEGELLIPFDPDGGIGKDYGFSGKISGATINLTKEFTIKSLTTEITHIKDSDSDIFKIKIRSGHLLDLKLANSEINLRRENTKLKIESLIHTKGKLDSNQIKKISYLFNFNLSNFKKINGIVDLKTKVNFNIDKKFKIENFTYLTEGNIDYFEIETDEKTIIKQYLPEYDPKIILKNTKIRLINSKSENILELDGLIKIKNHFDKLKIKEIYNYEKKFFEITGSADLTNSKVRISRLNYNKSEGQECKITFDLKFNLNKNYNIKSLIFLEDKSKIDLTNVKLNKDFQIEDFENIKIKTFKRKIKNNDFTIKNPDKVEILGEIFDAEPLLKSLYKKKKKKIFSKNFNNQIKINFNKLITGTKDEVFDFSMIASVVRGSYEKLNLKGNFSQEEIVEMSIYKVDDGKKTLQVISDRARPFIKNFDFVKGFEGGKLEYESIFSKKISNSNLLISDFKVSKVPALAQLLTLASLQGIADTLSGEGIRFDSFEMKSNSKGNILNIEDALAMGPAVSILLNGYVDKGKIVSLRGTLVPATKLNSIIASIPVVGDILVGKKTGEGVVGVSFRMKGPPKDIKTTVNPIKTLTPRFIVRAVEKLTKKKKEETK